MAIILAIMDGQKVQAHPMESLSEARKVGEYLAKVNSGRIVVSETGKSSPFCIYEKGKLIFCACPDCGASKIQLPAP